MPTLSPTLAINQLCLKRLALGERIFRFGFGQSPFPIPQVMVEALKSNAHRKDYLDSSGLLALREAIAAYHSREIDFTADNVVISPGSKEIIWLIQLLWDKPLILPGSKEIIWLIQLLWDKPLILPGPSWVSYAPQARLAGNKVFWVQTSSSHGWLMDPQVLDKLCTNNKLEGSLLLLNYPCNPTGSVPDYDHLAEIAMVAEKHSLLVISDEIYNEILFDTSYTSIHSIIPERTIITNGLSKIYGAGGWRLGYALFPEVLNALRESIVSAASETYSCVATPVQYAALKAFENSSEIKDYKRKASHILSVIAKYCHRNMSSLDTSLVMPKGGFYLFPTFSLSDNYRRRYGIYTSSDLTEKILKDTGVALLPGVVFGRPEEEMSCRLSFVDFEGEKVLDHYDAGQCLGREILDNVPNISEGILTILDYFKSQ